MMKRGIWTLLVAMLLVMSAALAAPALAQGEGYGIRIQAGPELPCIDGYFYFAPVGSALELTGDFSEPSPIVTYHAWEGGDWGGNAGSVLSGISGHQFTASQQGRVQVRIDKSGDDHQYMELFVYAPEDIAPIGRQADVVVAPLGELVSLYHWDEALQSRDETMLNILLEAECDWGIVRPIGHDPLHIMTFDESRVRETADYRLKYRCDIGDNPEGAEFAVYEIKAAEAREEAPALIEKAEPTLVSKVGDIDAHEGNQGQWVTVARLSSEGIAKSINQDNILTVILGEHPDLGRRLNENNEIQVFTYSTEQARLSEVYVTAFLPAEQNGYTTAVFNYIASDDANSTAVGMSIVLPELAGDNTAYLLNEPITATVKFTPIFDIFSRYHIDWHVTPEDAVDWEETYLDWSAWDRCFEDDPMTRAEIPLHVSVTEDACVTLTFTLHDPVGTLPEKTASKSFWVTETGEAPASTTSITSNYSNGESPLILYEGIGAVRMSDLFSYKDSAGHGTSGLDVELSNFDDALYYFGGGSGLYIAHGRGDDREFEITATSKTTGATATAYLKVVRPDLGYDVHQVSGARLDAMIERADDPQDHMTYALELMQGKTVVPLADKAVEGIACYGINAEATKNGDQIDMDVYPDGFDIPRTARAGVLVGNLGENIAPMAFWNDVRLYPSGTALFPFARLEQDGSALYEGWFPPAGRSYTITLEQRDANGQPLQTPIDLSDYEIWTNEMDGAHDASWRLVDNDTKIELTATYEPGSGVDVFVGYPGDKETDLFFAQYNYWPQATDTTGFPNPLWAEARFVNADGQALPESYGYDFASMGQDLTLRIQLYTEKEGAKEEVTNPDDIMKFYYFEVQDEHGGWARVPDELPGNNYPIAFTDIQDRTFQAVRPGAIRSYVMLHNNDEDRYDTNPLYVFDGDDLAAVDDVTASVAAGEVLSLYDVLGLEGDEFVLNSLLRADCDDQYAQPLPGRPLDVVGLNETPEGETVEYTLRYDRSIAGHEEGEVFAVVRLTVGAVNEDHDPLIAISEHKLTAPPRMPEEEATIDLIVATLTDAGADLTEDNIRVYVGGCSQLRGYKVEAGKVIATILPADHPCYSRINVVAQKGYTTAISCHLAVEPADFTPQITASLDDPPSGQDAYKRGDVVTANATLPGIDPLCRYWISWELDDLSGGRLDDAYNHDWDWDFWNDHYNDDDTLRTLPLKLKFAEPTNARLRMFLIDPATRQEVVSDTVSFSVTENGEAPTTASVIQTVYTQDNLLTLVEHTGAVRVGKLFSVTPPDATDLIYEITLGQHETADYENGWIFARDAGPARVTATSATDLGVTATAYIHVIEPTAANGIYWFESVSMGSAVEYGETLSGDIRLRKETADSNGPVDLDGYDVECLYNGFKEFEAEKGTEPGVVSLSLTAEDAGDDGWYTVLVVDPTTGIAIARYEERISLMDEVPFSRLEWVPYDEKWDNFAVVGEDFIAQLRPVGGAWKDGVTIEPGDGFGGVAYKGYTWDDQEDLLKITLRYDEPGGDNGLGIDAYYEGKRIAGYWFGAWVLENKPIGRTTVQVAEDSVYNRGPQQPTVTVKDGNTTLTLGTDYTLEYQNNVDATTAQSKAAAVVTGIGQYEGIVSKGFDIAAYNLSAEGNAAILPATIPDQVYTGSEITPAVTVTDNSGAALTPGVDYTVAYTGNTAVTASPKVTVTGKGNYEGQIEKPFTIVKANQSAPIGVVGVASTIKGKPDGRLTGVTTIMEYKKDGAQDYTPGTGSPVENLVAGAYRVRAKGDDNRHASPDAVVSIPEGAATLTVTFDANYPGGPRSSVGDLAWEATLTPPALTREGYALEGWFDTSGVTGGTEWTDSSKVTGDITLYARWTAKTDIKYTVEHYQETLSGGYDLKGTDNLAGTAGDDTNAAAKTSEQYPGFVIPTVQQQTIAPDGSTVVKLYYERKSSKLVFTVDITGDGVGDITLIDTSVKFGAPIAAPAVRVEGRVFTGWQDGATIPTAMPASDQTFVALTVAANTDYTVEHYRQNLALNGYDKYQTETISGAGDMNATELATAAQKRYEGFAYDQAKTELSGTTLKLYYARNSYTWTLGSNALIKTEGSTANGNIPYGTEITAKAAWQDDASATTHNWLGWQSGDENLLAGNPNAEYKFKMPAGNVALTPATAPKSFTVTFDANGGTGGKRATAAHGTAIATIAPTVTRTGYAFEKWYTDAACQTAAGAQVTGDVTLYAGWTPNEGTPYTVEHHRQALDGGYVLFERETGKTGTTATQTEATAKTYQGFSVQPFDQQSIAPDGSTVVKVYYNRGTYRLTFKPDASGTSDIVVTGVKYGASITAPALSMPGYVLTGWSPILPAAMPASDAAYVAQWTQATDTPYTVRHFQQGLDGSSRTLVLTEQFRGTTGANITVTSKSYPGFTAPTPPTDRTIGAAGDTVIELTYARKTVTLTFDAVGGTGGGTRTGQFGAPVTPPAPTKMGYTFLGWKPAAPATMPADNITYTAQWGTGNITYKVEHYQEALSGTFAPAETETLKGETNARVTAIPKSFGGFTYQPDHDGEVLSGTVAANGSLTLKLYYARNRYNLTFDAAGGTGGTTTLTAFGAAITPPTTTRAGYAFLAWSPAVPAAMPAADAVYTASWKPVSCAYTVNHHREALDGSYATIVRSGSGAAGVLAQAAPESYTGFTYDAARSTANGVIRADGSLALDLYYNRNRHQATFDAGGGAGGTDAQLKFGAPIAQPAVTRQGYAFAGWSPAVPTTMPNEAKRFTAQWTPATDTPYAVEHYWENLDGSWPETPGVREARTGTTGAALDQESARKHDEGFARLDGKTAPSATIAADGSTVYRLYYLRDEYTLTFDTDGDNVADLTIKVKYGSLISRQVNAVSKSIQDAQAGGVTVPTPIRDDGLFNGWQVGGSGSTGAGTIPSQVTGDLELTALYITGAQMQTMSEYVVQHYVDGTLRESDRRYGTAGTTATYAPNDYSGYVFKPNEVTFSSSAGVGNSIQADGSLRVKLYYGKAKYTVNVDGNGCSNVKINDQNALSAQFEQGAQVTVKATAPTGYTLTGWASQNALLPGGSSESYAFTMPAGNVSLKAVLTAQTYSITYPVGFATAGFPTSHTYGRSTTLPTPASTDPTQGFVGWNINGSSALYTAIPATQTGDAALTAVFKKIVTLTFDANGGSFGAGGLAFLTGLEGAPVTGVPTPTAPQGKTFGGWGTVPAVFPSTDATYTAQWTTPGGGGGEAPAEKIPVTDAVMATDSLSVQVGKTANASVALTPSNANDYKLTWSSDKPQVATVSGGVVTGVAEGKATITAVVESRDKVFTLTCAVTVTKADEPGPDPGKPAVLDTIIDTMAIANGRTTALPKFKGAKVSWKVEDETVAKISKGNIRALKAGETHLILTVESPNKRKAALALDGSGLEAGQTYKIELKVRKAGELATKVSISGKKSLKLDLKENKAIRLTATAGPAKKVVDKQIFWASKNPGIATVDENGLVTAVAPGKTEIYAYSASLKRAKVTVEVGGLVTKLRIVNDAGKALKKATLRVDEQLMLKAVANADALNPAVEWTSGKPKIATVSQDGTVTALKKGTVTITAKALDGSGKKVKITITVK